MIRLNPEAHFDAEPSRPRFSPGDLVRHRRYGYRGVVVEADPRCRADEAWYQSNKTQPRRDQPWYHVLVDGRLVSTYAAEENLSADQTGDPVDHPWVEKFFDDFADGRYIRNDTPWSA